MSILTWCVCQSLTRPQSSVIRTSSSWMPSPVTVTGVVSVPATSPLVTPSSRHWMRWMPGEPLGSAVMSRSTDGSVIQPLGMTVVSPGPAMLTITVWSIHALRLPTSSTERVRKLWMPCVPMRTTVPSGPEPGACASICHSTRSTPESASVAVTGTSTAPFCQPTGVIVVSTGRVLSTRTVSLRSLRLPAASTAAVSSWWAPVPLTLAELPVVQPGRRRCAIPCARASRRARPPSAGR